MSALREEIAGDPLGRGYAGMTNAQIVVSLETKNRSRARKAVSGSDVFEAAVPSEFNTLLPDQKTLFLGIVGMGEIQVNGTNTRAALLAMFGVGTTTRSNLAALQTETISRAEEIGVGIVSEGRVAEARANG